jgi:hypothetical protein
MIDFSLIEYIRAEIDSAQAPRGSPFPLHPSICAMSDTESLSNVCEFFVVTSTTNSTPTTTPQRSARHYNELVIFQVSIFDIKYCYSCTSNIVARLLYFSRIGRKYALQRVKTILLRKLRVFSWYFYSGF